jgi:hypothetical protein
MKSLFNIIYLLSLLKTCYPYLKIGTIMKFILFTIVITLSSFGFSNEQVINESHASNKEHDQHNGHGDAHKGASIQQNIHPELIVIDNPMIKTTPPGISNSAAYFTIINNSEKDITLIDVASDAAQFVEMHEHVVSNGKMKMQKMEPLKIAAKGSASFQPGGYHIMFIGVTQAIKNGDEIDITLRFDDGTKKIITSVAKKKYESEAALHKHH